MTKSVQGAVGQMGSAMPTRRVVTRAPEEMATKAQIKVAIAQAWLQRKEAVPGNGRRTSHGPVPMPAIVLDSMVATSSPWS
jgi:hypothetical protein